MSAGAGLIALGYAIGAAFDRYVIPAALGMGLGVVATAIIR